MVDNAVLQAKEVHPLVREMNYSIHALSPYEGVDGHVATEDANGSLLVYDNMCYAYEGLQPYSKYIISVQAATYAGESEASQPPVFCENSERSEPPIPHAPSTVDNKSPTQLSIFHQQFSERNGPISCYEIIVVHILVSKETGSFVFETSVSPDSIYEYAEFNRYEDVNGIPGQAYVAVRMTRENFREEVMIGDGRLTECTKHSNAIVKRDSTQYSYEGEVYNGELESETWYTVFVRAYIDNPSVDGQVFFTSSPFMEPIKTGISDKASIPFAPIIAVCVVIIIAVICVVVAVFIIRRRRRKADESQPGDHPAQDDDVYTELTEVHADTYEKLRINPDGKPLQSRDAVNTENTYENMQSDYQVVI